MQYSGLKDGSNNICPLRNQFQMLNVTNRSWKFGVGRRGGYQETPIKEESLFFSRKSTLSEFSAAFRITHWSCRAMQNEELLALWLQDVSFSKVAQSS